MDITPPANDEPAAAPTHQAQLDAITQAIGDQLIDAVLLMRVINPEGGPLGTASEVFRWIATALATIMPEQVILPAMLIAFEAQHPQAMTFIQTEKAKQMLTNIANARRKLDAAGRGIILPAGFTPTQD